MEEKFFLSAVKLFFRINPIASLSKLSNEILYILVAQETIKLLNVKLKV